MCKAKGHHYNDSQVQGAGDVKIVIVMNGNYLMKKSPLWRKVDMPRAAQKDVSVSQKFLCRDKASKTEMKTKTQKCHLSLSIFDCDRYCQQNGHLE